MDTPGAGRTSTGIRARGSYRSTASVAKQLCISPGTVRLWAECGEIPAVKVGRLWRFDEAALSEWLARRAAAGSEAPSGLRGH